MTASTAQLPAPSSAARQLSVELSALIREEIAAAGGWIDFSRYMELALYTPGLGYYSAGSAKLGAAGDFVTAPELSDLLGRALAATLERELAQLDAPTVLELGAGSGKLAVQVLDALSERGRDDVAYRILERSADLRARQQRELERYGVRVSWIDGLPGSAIDGAVIANEVIDALPVARFVKRAGDVRPLGVAVASAELRLCEGARDQRLSEAVTGLEAKLGRTFPEGYVSEICLLLPVWLKELAASLRRGSLVFVDYGLTRREYYHEQRSEGTLICHYRHRAHQDPLSYPGLTDLSAWVDFSACADAAEPAGLTVAGFTTQAQFLLGTAAADPGVFASAMADARERSALQTLILPGEMGERFKVLLLRKGVDSGPLPGSDQRHRL